MRTVDFRPFPDRSELREQLIAAFGEVDLGDASTTEPIAEDAAVGIAFPAELSDDELRERAEALRAQVEDRLTDATVRFVLADGQAGTDEGSPDHLE